MGLRVTSGPGPITGNDPAEAAAEQAWICRTCNFAAKTYGRVEKHADRLHGDGATRIEQVGLLP